MTHFLFWFCLAALAYSYAAYPLLVALIARTRVRSAPRDDVATPRMSILVSAFNEELVIASKIENFQSLEYPEDSLELLVVSDASTDATDAIVAGCGDARVRLLVQPTRQGKTAALNRAVREATGDILVFTDADSLFRPGALRHLAYALADPEVGLASGRTLPLDPVSGKPATAGVYRAYEEWIKKQEGRAFSIVGADGAIYALRRELYEPLSPDLINDFAHAAQTVTRGYRAVSAEQAVCTEPSEDRGGGELARQTRIISQSWLVAARMLPGLAEAGKWGYAWQLASHKILRWLGLPLMAGLLLSNAMLASRGMGYALALVGQLVFYATALAGRRGRTGIAKVPYYFMILQVAGLVGLFQYARGNSFITWKPRAN